LSYPLRQHRLMKTITDEIKNEVQPINTGSPTPVSDSPSPAPTRLAGESARAFEAFRAYLALGPDRRYSDVGAKVGAGLRTAHRSSYNPPPWNLDFGIWSFSFLPTRHGISTSDFLSSRCQRASAVSAAMPPKSEKVRQNETLSKKVKTRPKTSHFVSKRPKTSQNVSSNRAVVHPMGRFRTFLWYMRTRRIPASLQTASCPPATQNPAPLAMDSGSFPLPKTLSFPKIGSKK